LRRRANLSCFVADGFLHAFGVAIQIGISLASRTEPPLVAHFSPLGSLILMSLPSAE